MTKLMFAHNCTHECTKTNGARCSRDPSVEASVSICDACPVLDHCRWWAVITNLTHGVAGGLTYAQRLSIRKKLRRDPDGNALIEGMIELCPEP